MSNHLPLLLSASDQPGRPTRRGARANWRRASPLALVMATLMLVTGRADIRQKPDGPRRTDADIAARVDRVLKGLRPRIEVENAPARWTLAERMAAYKISAVSFAIVDGGRVVWAKGFGTTEAGGKVPVTATTLFQVASCSKPVAVSAMLRMVDKGALSLDTNVNQYLKSWKLPENDFTKEAPVTLRRIGTHTAGTTVGGFPGYKADAPRPTVPQLLDGRPPANNEPVRVDQLPGRGFRYSGGGYTIMQQLLVDVAGTSFPALAEKEVFGPLGMKHSTFEQPLPPALAANAARAYEKNVLVSGGWHVYPELAAAGLWTTPTDLATWAIAMADALTGRSARFLSQATASQILTSAVPGRSEREKVGLGLLLYGTGETLNFVHNGQNEGFMSEFKMYATRGQGIAVAINSGEAGFNLVREIQNAVAAEFEWPEQSTTKITTVALDPAAMDAVTGTYEFTLASGRLLPRIVREGTKLYFENWGLTARWELHPQSPTTFIANIGTRLSFSVDATGRGVLTMGEGPRAQKGIKQ
jgi:CubicO group peptidase (beta-lactamase class C family)